MPRVFSCFWQWWCPVTQSDEIPSCDFGFVCTWKCKTSPSVYFLSFWFTSIMMAYASTHSLFSSLSSLSSRCFLTCMSDWIQSSTCSFVAAGRKRCVNKWRQHLFQPVRRADLWRRSWQKMEGFDKQTSLLCDRNEAFSVTQSSNYGSVSFFFPNNLTCSKHSAGLCSTCPQSWSMFRKQTPTDLLKTLKLNVKAFRRYPEACLSIE